MSRWSSAVGALFVLIVLIVGKSTEAFCPTACQCNDVELAAYCPHAQLGIVPITLNPGIKILDLENNRIRDLTNALQFYSELETLNLSKNQISNLRDLHFEAQTKLKHLRLAHNDIEALHSDSFVGLQSLHTLDLGHNRVQHLPPDIFADLTSIEVLVLEGNLIETIDRAAFRGLAKLTTLNVKNNGFTSICGVFGGVLPSLRELDVGSNPVRFHAAPFKSSPITSPASTPTPSDHVDETSSACFASWAPNLEVLSISDMSATTGGVKVLPKGLFSGLPRLRVLHLEENVLHDVCDYNWDLPNLVELYLAGNVIVSLGPRCFQGLPNLQILEASWNSHLKTITNMAFSANPRLQIAAFDHAAQLTTIEPSAFSGVTNLRQLSFRFCDQLPSFPKEAFKNTLHFFELTGSSNIECNCSMTWYLELLLDTSLSTTSVSQLSASNITTTEKYFMPTSPPPTVAYFSDVTCSSTMGPMGTRGHRLSSLTMDSLECTKFEPWQIIAIGVLAAVIFVLVTSFAVTMAVLRCRAARNSKPSIMDTYGGPNGANMAVSCGRFNHHVAPRKDECSPAIFFLENSPAEAGQFCSFYQAPLPPPTSRPPPVPSQYHFPSTIDANGINHYQQLVYTTRMIQNGGRRSKKRRDRQCRDSSTPEERQSMLEVGSTRTLGAMPPCSTPSNGMSMSVSCGGGLSTSSTGFDRPKGDGSTSSGSGASSSGVSSSKTWHNRAPWTIFDGNKEEQYIYRTPDGGNAIIPVTEL